MPYMNDQHLFAWSLIYMNSIGNEHFVEEHKLYYDSWAVQYGRHSKYYDITLYIELSI